LNSVFEQQSFAASRSRWHQFWTEVPLRELGQWRGCGPDRLEAWEKYTL
jgi:hypothetical protein